MIISKNTHEIFQLLDKVKQNTFSFKSDFAVSFEDGKDFCLVIFISSGDEKGLLLYRMENFSENAADLHHLQFLLSGKTERTSRQNVFLEAIRLVQQRAEAFPPQQLFFDAH